MGIRLGHNVGLRATVVGILELLIFMISSILGARHISVGVRHQTLENFQIRIRFVGPRLGDDMLNLILGPGSLSSSLVRSDAKEGMQGNRMSAMLLRLRSGGIRDTAGTYWDILVPGFRVTCLIGLFGIMQRIPVEESIFIWGTVGRNISSPPVLGLGEAGLGLLNMGFWVLGFLLEVSAARETLLGGQ